MTGLELLTATGVIAGKEIVKKSVAALISACSDQVGKSIKSFQNEKTITSLYQQIGKIRKVKTLGQLDKAVDLTKFYCDSHVYISDKRIRVRELNDFPSNANILIEGIAGQGKSIFLRYLSSVEALKGKVVPIFAELRRIKSEQSLTDFLIETLKSYKLTVDTASLNEIADSGRLVFLLDAFDEVPDHSKSRILVEIETFAADHENSRLIITSRPESGIAACTSFDCVKLSDLEGKEYIDVINIITEDAELAEGLINQIKEHKGQIKGLLITPLLVTLLVIRYKSFQELPAQLSDFYDSLFQLLLQRHDGLKPGYRRSRRCKMNDFQYRQVFESFCFNTKKFGARPLCGDDVYKASESALLERKIEDNPEEFVDDIVKVTCLVVKDGEEYRFIHKSVQEYYTAAYIHQRPESVASLLYKKLFEKKYYWAFQQEIRFLKEIDSYKFQKYGVLPLLQVVLKIDHSNAPLKGTQAMAKAVEEIIGDCKISYKISEKIGAIGGVRSIEIPYFGPFTDEAMKLLDNELFQHLFSDPHMGVRFSKDELQSTLVKKFIAAAKSPLLNRALKNCAEKISKILLERVHQAHNIVGEEEEFDPFCDFANLPE